MIMQVVMAVIGTIAFCVLFGVPAKYYAYCGIVGGAGWLLYMLLTLRAGMSVVVATFFSSLLVIALARRFAVLEKCPATVFVIAGIIPLVPGVGICWSAYYIVSDQLPEALSSGLTAVKSVIAIVLGIIIVFDLPGRIFSLRIRKS